VPTPDNFVQCDGDSNLVGLYLTGLNAVGTVSSAVGNRVVCCWHQRLFCRSFANNFAMNGTLPTEFGGLSNLKAAYVLFFCDRYLKAG
jgi:hypothetical protein